LLVSDLSNGANVDCSELCAVLRIGLGIESYLLTLSESLEALNLDRGEMYEHIVSTVVVGNKAVALFRVEPLDRTVIHFGYLH
jgi:hypothetical protein